MQKEQFERVLKSNLARYVHETCLIPDDYINPVYYKVEKDVRLNAVREFYSAEPGRKLDNFKTKLTKGLIAQALVAYLGDYSPDLELHEAKHYDPADLVIDGVRIEVKALEVYLGSRFRNGWATDRNVLSSGTPMILISSEMVSEHCTIPPILLHGKTSNLLWPARDTGKAYFYFFNPKHQGYEDVGDYSVGGAVQNRKKIIFLPKTHSTLAHWIANLDS